MKQTNKKWLLLAAGDGETRWLRDHSRHRRDAQLKGDRCHVDGTLNLTDNISTDFYDFGSGSANSLFLRAGTFAAGCKFGGKTAQKGIFIINHKKWIR